MKNEEIMLKASQAIKPALWFTNSILEKAELATEKEIAELKRLTDKTLILKAECWNLDQKISDILSNIDRRKEGEKQR